MMPNRNMFSGLYRISGGRLRQTSDIRPMDFFFPACLLPKGLKKSTQREKTYRPSLPLVLKSWPSKPLKFRKISASKISFISLEGVKFVDGAQASSIFSSNPDRDSKPPSQSLKLKATKGLIGRCIVCPFVRRGFRRGVPHFFPSGNSRWVHVSG